MAMRGFGRALDLTAFAFAADTHLACDLMVLRAEDLAAVLWPDHFFFTAGCAAARDATFFLAICASLFCLWRGGETKNFFFVGERERAPPPHPGCKMSWWGRLSFFPPPPPLSLLTRLTPS